MSVAFADLASANHYREEPLMRFSVKCDRARAGRIRSAAAEAGLTVESFVQRHFETILDVASAPRLEPTLDLAGDPVRVHRLSRLEGISPTHARLALSLAGHCDADGTFQMSRAEMAARFDIIPGSVQRSMDALMRVGLLKTVVHCGGRMPSRFSIDLDRVLA